jgi:hypothetical protein
MSIVRVGIIVAIVVAVLPADKEQQARLYSRAADAVHWTATFCDRNGQTCDQAGNLWSAFVQKARFGASMAYDLAIRYTSNDSGHFDVTPLRPSPVSQGTLTREDLEPVWRGRDGV